jgi:hypothetical protein
MDRSFVEHKLFRLEWPVDQWGYEIEPRRGDGPAIAQRYEYEVIRPCGGPPRYYRPMEEHALWRRFADAWVTKEGALEFSTQFGLLTERESTLDAAFDLAAHLRTLMNLMDDGQQWRRAAFVFNQGPRPRLTATMDGPNQRGRYQLQFAPLELGGALILQAGESITGNQVFRRCRNCSKWMRIGDGAYTNRREYCSDKCRVAWSRRSRGENP